VRDRQSDSYHSSLNTERVDENATRSGWLQETAMRSASSSLYRARTSRPMALRRSGGLHMKAMRSALSFSARTYPPNIITVWDSKPKYTKSRRSRGTRTRWRVLLAVRLTVSGGVLQETTASFAVVETSDNNFYKRIATPPFRPNLVTFEFESASTSTITIFITSVSVVGQSESSFVGEATNQF
jgi:hypothetical protein